MNKHYIFTVPHGAEVEIKYEERRDPNRGMYQYKTSADPRIRALERRGVKINPMSDIQWCESAKAWVPTDRRWQKDRRIANVDCSYYRCIGPRRKS